MKNSFTSMTSKLPIAKIFQFNRYYQKIIDFLYRLKLEKLCTSQQSREAWLDNIVEKVIANKPGAFIDVGVNEGQTLLKVKSIAPDIVYVGFEPNLRCCFYANDLIALKQLRHSQIIPVGLYDRATVLKLWLRNHENVSASVVDGFRDPSFYTSATYVPVFDGDYLFSLLELEAISIIKIDVEGAELEVILGLRESIAKHKPYIFCEVLPPDNANNQAMRKNSFRQERQDLLAQTLKKAGYKIYRISHQSEVIPLDQFPLHSDPLLCEYVFVPTEETQDDSLINQIQKEVQLVS